MGNTVENHKLLVDAKKKGINLKDENKVISYIQLDQIQNPQKWTPARKQNMLTYVESLTGKKVQRNKEYEQKKKKK